MSRDFMAARSSQAIVLDNADNVATAIVALRAGERVTIGEIAVDLVDDIAFGHKFALADLTPGESVIKFGAPIGLVTAPIARGAHVHVHNVRDIVQDVRAKHRV